MFPDAPEVKKTMNYDLFKKIDWNRSVCKRNFLKLLHENKLKFQLHKFPILVTEDFKIVDGQHRFEVAKEIGSPIYYIMSGNDDSFTAVHSVNKAGKKHSLKDKVEMLYRSGDEGAETVYRFFNLYEGLFDISTITSLFVADSNGGNINEAIDKSGSIPLNNYTHATAVLKAVSESGIPGKGKSRIVFALSIISKRSGIHPRYIVTRVMSNLVKWVDPKSMQEAQRVIIGCYNYGLQYKNRINIDKNKNQ